MTKPRLILVMLLSVVAGLSLAAPASAWEEPPVDDDGSNLVGRVGEQINDLNNGNPGGGTSKPPTCDWEQTIKEATPGPGPEPAEPETKLRHDGVLRWVEPANGHEFWGDSDVVDGEGGMVFRYECWHPDMNPLDCEDHSQDGACLGQPVDTNMCDMFLCRFPDIEPENIARYMVDSFVESLPPPTPRFNPPNGTTYVNFDTWMWVDGIPNGGTITPDPISVPGMTVHTTANVDKIGWTMGDGGGVDCPLTVTEANAETECSYSYTRSSASQPNNAYTGQASIVWLADWYVEQNPGVSGTVEAPRSTDFNLEVAEIQTIVR